MGIRVNQPARVALALLAAAHLFPLQAAAIIQLRVIEGDGAVYASGSRATRGITVQVTDETGQPVDAAAVSFRLPDDGPGGPSAADSVPRSSPQKRTAEPPSGE